MTHNFEINTIDDLVKFTVENPHLADTKWELNDSADWAWVAGRGITKTEESWTLDAKDSPITLALTTEIGHALDAIWTKKAPYRDAPYKVRATNGLTLKGMLKRLGRSDIKAAIADAEEKTEIERRKNARNAARQRVSALAKEIAKIKHENPDINWPAGIEEMINIELED